MISVCILAKNSEATLASTLDSLKQFREIIVLDTGSTDRTIEIARTYPNVSVYEAPFTGFGKLRNRLADLANNDWILAIDSDESLSYPLQEEIARLKLTPSCVYEISFVNFYEKKHIKGCGWHPEKHVRLYHRKMTRFSDAELHEGVKISGMEIIQLKHPIHHIPYRSISDFLAKMQHYSDLFAKQHQGKKSSSFAKAFGHGVGAFFKSYFLKKGCFLGKEGWIISVYNANTAFYKYLKLAEANRRLHS